MLLAHGHLGMAQHVAQLGWHLVVNALHGKEERIFVGVAKRSYLKEQPYKTLLPQRFQWLV